MTCYGIYNYDNLELDGSYDTATQNERVENLIESLPTKQTHSAPLHTFKNIKGTQTGRVLAPAHTCQDRPHMTCDACEIVGKQ